MHISNTKYPFKRNCHNFFKPTKILFFFGGKYINDLWFYKETSVYAVSIRVLKIHRPVNVIDTKQKKVNFELTIDFYHFLQFWM